MPNNNKVLVIAGGCGIAPLFFLVKKIYTVYRTKSKVIIGVRGRENLVYIDEFCKYSDVYITTEDGSVGEKGVVSEHSILKQKDIFDRIYACGPYPMLASVAKYAEKLAYPCEVSMEALMACGFGACLCCAIKTKDGYKQCCVAGPVFNAKDILW